MSDRINRQVSEIQDVSRSALESGVLNLPKRLAFQPVPLVDQLVDPLLLLIDLTEDFLDHVRRCWMRTARVVIGDRAWISLRLQLGDLQTTASDQIVQESDVLQISLSHINHPFLR